MLARLHLVGSIDERLQILDDTLLHEVGGVTDFEPYRADRAAPLAPDFFVPESMPAPPGVTLAARIR